MSNQLNPQQRKALKDISKVTDGLTKALTTLVPDAISILEKYGQDKLEELEQRKGDLEARIEGLQDDFAERLREAQVELKVQVKEDSLRTFNALAKELNMAIIDNKEYNTLMNDLYSAQNQVEEGFAKAEEKAQATYSAKLSNTRKTMELQQQVENAQLTAQSDAKDAIIAELRSQVEDLKYRLEGANALVSKVSEGKSSIVNIGDK